MLILTASEVAAVFDMEEAFAATREAAIAVSERTAVSPQRTALHAGEPQAEVLVMPGVVDDALIGTKTWYTYGRQLASAPSTAAFITVLDPELGEEVLVEGSRITDFRTGALSGLAVEKLAAPEAETLTVIGAGIQARTQILAILHARPSIQRVRVASRTAGRRNEFVATMNSELKDRGYRVVISAADDVASAVGEADIVVAATTSSSPVVFDEWITKPGVVLCGVGSHDRQSSEIDSALVARAHTVAVDSFTGGLDGAADISAPVEQGLIKRDAVIELGDLIRWEVALPSELSVFKSVGFSAADIVAAAYAARAATRRGLGRRVDLHR